MKLALTLEGVRGHVETSRLTRSRKRDVAPLLQARLARPEDEGAVDGHALSAVACQRVRVADVPGFQVRAAQVNSVAAVGRDSESAARFLNALDGAARAVLDSEAVAVSEA